MSRYYQINTDSIVIKPLAFLIPVGFTVVAILLVLPLSIILMLVKGHIEDIEIKYFASYLFMLPLLLGCIPFFTYGKQQIIFDGKSQSIFKQTVFKKHLLMRFDEVASITFAIRLGLAYYIKSIDDRYGKGFRISPSFTGEQDKAKVYFDETLLPEIWVIIQKGQVEIQPSEAAPVNPDQMTFYVRHHQTFELKKGSILKLLLPLLLFAIFAGYFWFNLLTKVAPSDSDKRLSVFVLIPILYFLLSATKRIVFDLGSKKIKVYRLGLLFKSYNVSNFDGFNIVRKTYNGAYSGTDLRLKFKAKSSVTELTLGDFGKTNPIESMITETEYILKTMLNYEQTKY